MWVPLHVHSQYSILDAAASVPDIAKRAAAYGMPAVALTDHGNLFGAIEFYKACKEAKVKPILGCEFYVAPESRHERKKDATSSKTAFHLGLLAKNLKGYHNLCKLSSIGYIEGFYYHPRIDHEVLAKYSEGLICLSGCLSSRCAQEILTGGAEKAEASIQFFLKLFGEDFYIELQRHQMSESDLQADGFYQESWLLQQYQDYISKQTRVNQALLELARKYNIKVVATNDSHYMDREDWRAHEILLNIQSGEPCEIWERDSQGNPKRRIPNPKRRTYSTHECYFKSPEQMLELFKDVPEAIHNTLEVAQKCNVTIDFTAKHYPVYVPPSLKDKEYTKEEQATEAEKFLRRLCEEGIERRYTPERLAAVKEVYKDKDPLEVVRERLKLELSIIVPKGMCDYLLIVWDFIYWAKQNGIPVGPGRGSGAGSIVLYLIGVTDIEPLRFHLFFERFINPERISYPDIDVDICMDQRSKVILYTLEKYGKDNVAQIITFGTMKAKMTVKDVGRVLNIPLAKVNAIAKLIPEDLNITLSSALEKDRDLRQMYEEDDDAHRIIDLGKKLEGSIRSTGIHAAGIIISGDPLTEHIPICLSKDSELPATQYSMKPVEMVGMLKIDFLGLKTLTAIQICVEAIQQTIGKQIDWIDLPLNDAPTFQLLNQGKTVGIFQLESGGMQDLARQLHLDKFEEIIAVGALYRPGPMDMIPSFISRKHGREQIEYDHPWMQDILAETYGIMVYQEQVMQIASKLARYSLGEGDILRKAMGKKDMEQMVKQREKFRNGAIQNGIEEATAMQIFDKMEKFAAYGFNKSHAAAYGYLSYVTAYLKANFPKEWMAALMTCDSADIARIAEYIRECKTMGIEILLPDINEAASTFVATPKGIRFAMSGIKGIGEGVVETIIDDRKRNGKFTNLYQFLKRIDSKKIGRKTVEHLVDAGCFDFTGWSRDALRQCVDPMYEAAAREQKDTSMGVLSLFSLLGDTEEERFKQAPTVKLPRSKMDVLLKEKELLGIFLTGHPLDDYRHQFSQLSCVPLNVALAQPHDTVFRAALLIEDMQLRLSSKTQKKFAILTVSDGLTSCELPIWSDLYDSKHSLLQPNQVLYTVLQVDKKDGSDRLACKWLDDLTQISQTMIEECDRAFDRTKFQSTQAKKNFTPNRQAEKKTSPEVKKLTNIHLIADAKEIRLSHIMQLKELFSQHRGPTPIQLDFWLEHSVVATIQIDSKWGVTMNDQLLKALHQLPGIKVKS